MKLCWVAWSVRHHSYSRHGPSTWLRCLVLCVLSWLLVPRGCSHLLLRIFNYAPAPYFHTSNTSAPCQDEDYSPLQHVPKQPTPPSLRIMASPAQPFHHASFCSTVCPFKTFPCSCRPFDAIGLQFGIVISEPSPPASINLSHSAPILPQSYLRPLCRPFEHRLTISGTRHRQKDFSAADTYTVFRNGTVLCVNIIQYNLRFSADIET